MAGCNRMLGIHNNFLREQNKIVDPHAVNY